MTRTATTPPTAEPAPPAAPRPVTPAASRRAWMEPRVRTWWLSTIVFLAIAIGWTLRQYLTWNRHASLIRDGQKLEATIWQPQDFGAGGRIPNRRIQAGAQAVLVWTVDGKEYNGRATFPETVLSATTKPVWVDPDDPNKWTSNPDVPPLSRELVALFILIPAILASALAAALNRRRVLGIWKNGEVHSAVAVDARLSAFAPLSRQVRCSLLDVPDRRLLTVTVPARKAIPAKGETFYVLAPPGDPTRLLAARAFT